MGTAEAWRNVAGVWGDRLCPKPNDKSGVLPPADRGAASAAEYVGRQGGVRARRREVDGDPVSSMTQWLPV